MSEHKDAIVPFTYAALLEQYLDVCIGQDHPDKMLVSGDLFDVLKDRVGGPPWRNPSMFLKAQIEFDPELPFQQIWFTNSKHPTDPKFNVHLRIDVQ